MNDLSQVRSPGGNSRRPLTAVENRRLAACVAIGANQQPDSISYAHSILSQVGLPRRKLSSDRFERTCGNASLLVEAGSIWTGGRWQKQHLPYGVKPRLALVHLCTEAVRNESPRVELGASVRDFLLCLGLDTSGAEYRRFISQMNALASCRMTLRIGATTIDARPIKRFDAWLDRDGRRRVLWPAEVELSMEFYESLVRHAVPLDPRALGALRNSALAIDVYVWLAHRLWRISSANGTTVSWSNLRSQFGHEYQTAKDFKKAFLKALRTALAVYPRATISLVAGGLKLLPSPPPHDTWP